MDPHVRKRVEEKLRKKSVEIWIVLALVFAIDLLIAGLFIQGYIISSGADKDAVLEGIGWYVSAICLCFPLFILSIFDKT